MSSISIPKPLETFFKSFPIHEHLAHPQTTSEERNAMKIQHTNFQSTIATKPSPYYFKICTYNTFISSESKNGYVLATDPLSLSLQIQLALKQGLKLGRCFSGDSDGEETDLKCNSLFVINYHGSEDGILPLYIERDVNSDKPGVVKTYSSLNEQMLREVKTSSERLLIKLVDIAIHDFFIITVLMKVNSDIQLKLFSSYNTPQERLLRLLGLKESLSYLVKRNGFEQRYPNIANQYNTSISTTITNHLLSSYHAQSLTTEYETALSLYKQAIKNLSSVYTNSTTFYQSDNVPSLLDVKIFSYVIIANEFLNNTEFGEELRLCSSLNRLSNSILKCVT